MPGSRRRLATVTNGSVTDEVARLKAENKTLKEKVADDVMVLLDALSISSRSPSQRLAAAQFAKILKRLHPDAVYRFHDEGLTKRFNEAFKIFNGLRSQLVK